MMKKIFILSMVYSVTLFVFAENIDPYETGAQYAYGENIGWLNFDPNSGGGVQIGSDKLMGFIWSENIGWINLHCGNTDICGTVSFGVINDGEGNLSGYAWAENGGWINFKPTYGGVAIDADGYLNGWAWGENIGWIHFDSTQGWSVQVCRVTLEDLSNFATYWLDTEPAANLDGSVIVNMPDYSIFASYWQDFCPDGWQLK